MAAIKAVIFDFDGTLADTLPNCIESFQQVFKRYDGALYTPDQILEKFGPTEPEIIKNNLPEHLHQAAVEYFFQLYIENHEEKVRPREDIDNLLRFLKKKGLILAIVTGKARRGLEISLDYLNMREYFDLLIAGDDVSKPKPDTEGIEIILKNFNLDRDEVIFIGDSDTDMSAGKGADILTIGAHWLENIQTKNFSVSPDIIMTSTDELIRYIESELNL